MSGATSAGGTVMVDLDALAVDLKADKWEVFATGYKTKNLSAEKNGACLSVFGSTSTVFWSGDIDFATLDIIRRHVAGPVTADGDLREQVAKDIETVCDWARTGLGDRCGGGCEEEYAALRRVKSWLAVIAEEPT